MTKEQSLPLTPADRAAIQAALAFHTMHLKAQKANAQAHANHYGQAVLGDRLANAQSVLAKLEMA